MRRALAISAAALGAVALAAIITLLLDGGEAARLAPAASDDGGAEAARPQPAAPPPAAPMPKVLRVLPPPAPTVTSALPPDDPEETGPLPRIVGGPGISPGPVVQGRMEREPPPQQPAPEPQGPQWQTFTQVAVIGAGMIDLGGRKIRLAGITVPSGGATCRNAATGEGLDCAFLSMQALRQRIRARGIECRLDAIEHLGAEPATCRVGATDLGQWLIEQGWAGAAADAPDDYRASEQQARCASAGIWETAPRPDSCPAQ